MGNCCSPASSSSIWAGEDWGSMGRQHRRPIDHELSQGLIDRQSPAKEVRITISRKQLEELLLRRGNDLKSNMNVDEMIPRLMENSHHFEVHRQGTWRPALQSIPEFD
ncbi:hypothetical protein Droror1_Dr00010582 [Drosera rotundifolia]